ncbi:L-threonylcarbamoyladenylate synthase [Gleimia hominis]|uniref:L-threonylcarbamoyladenylate synthase n=1 Tax=Gleimia hominis TaxID=595468 RepID=A0ABU3IBG2_9ACTO|nr:L-threonylcarbamoyladenylate synthase [Gleimia hominis]MDT3767686.1 L-threonylcarbamoyladenylate synthase [Gleimia hominis]
MAYVEIHPENPQTRLVKSVVDTLRNGGTIALPTDSGYAIATAMANKDGMDVIRQIRDLDEKHNFSFLCHNFSQLGSLVIVDNKAFRTIKALTPGPYTFILRGTKEIPRMTLNKKKHTVGVRIPDHKITQAIVEELGEPLLCSTLILPGHEEAMWNAEEVFEAVGKQVDTVIGGPVGHEGSTTVVDFTDGSPVVVREGAGSTELF